MNFEQIVRLIEASKILQEQQAHLDAGNRVVIQLRDSDLRTAISVAMDAELVKLTQAIKDEINA